MYLERVRGPGGNMESVGQITIIQKVLLALSARRIGSTASTATMTLVILGLLLSVGARAARADGYTYTVVNPPGSSASEA